MSRAHFLIAASLAAALCAGCKARHDWVSELKAEPLYQRAEKLRGSASCSGLVPMEFGRTFPVPVKDGGGGFQFFFYPLSVAPGKTEAMSPIYAARFSRDAADAGSCSKIEGAVARPIGAPVPAGLSMDDYYQAEAKLFSSLEPTAALYFSGAQPAAGGKSAPADFAEAFNALAEPGLLPDYYRANPDFWEWLRREAGRSIPKP